MTRSRRGLTLIEVLAALALLGLLATALSSWLQVTSDFASKAATTLPWESAAERTLQCIEDDLLVGDFAQAKKTPKKPRCSVIDNRLTILTRDPQHGPAQRDYLFESSEGRLDQVTQPVTASGHPIETRLLVGGVAAWTCEFDAKIARLTVSLTSTTGTTISRSFTCPP